jgi:hypothetical protein
MVRRLAALMGGFLALFHAWLFVNRLWQGEIADAGAILRWGVAGGLVAALWVLHQRGASLVRGRSAVAIWLLAALLHAPAMTGDHPGAGTPALAEVVVSLTQAAAAAALGLGLWVLAARVRRASAPRLCRVRAFSLPPALSVAPGWTRHVASRPPPLVPSFAHR